MTNNKKIEKLGREWEGKMKIKSTISSEGFIQVHNSDENQKERNF